MLPLKTHGIFMVTCKTERKKVLIAPSRASPVMESRGIHQIKAFCPLGKYGEVLERPNRRDWKSRRGATSSWVQIPSSPPSERSDSTVNPEMG